MTPTIQLGNLVKDSVTGFQGIAYGRTTYLHCEPLIGILPQQTDKQREENSISDAEWFTESRLVFVEKGLAQ